MFDHLSDDELPPPGAYYAETTRWLRARLGRAPTQAEQNALARAMARRDRRPIDQVRAQLGAKAPNDKVAKKILLDMLKSPEFQFLGLIGLAAIVLWIEASDWAWAALNRPEVDEPVLGKQRRLPRRDLSKAALGGDDHQEDVYIPPGFR